MKWNWGTKIVIAFVIFCGLMIFMVVKSFEQDFHLVTEDYYQQELRYQEKIDQIANARLIDYKPELQGTPEEVSVSFELSTPPTGSIHFYRPDNYRLDKIFEITDNKTTISKSDLAKGRYIVKINWEHEETKYYVEQEVLITK